MNHKFNSILGVFMSLCLVITMSCSNFAPIIANAEENTQISENQEGTGQKNEVSTEKSLLKEIQFSSDKDGKNLFKISPDLNSKDNEYTLIIPDYISSGYVKAVSTNSNSKISAICNSPWGGGELNVSLENDKFTSISFKNFTGKIKVDDTVYNFEVKKSATLKSLSINETLKPIFNRDTTNYDVYVPGNEDVQIKAVGYVKNYKIKLNGDEKTSITPVWDENQEMKLELEVSKDSLESTVYTIILHKEPQENEPYILIQPIGSDYLDNATKITQLKVKASANGNLTYQWYKNDSNKIEGGQAIEGATDKNYTPEVSDIGNIQEKHIYYYCIITNTINNEKYTTTSDIADIKITPDPTPVAKITTQDGKELQENYECSVGDTLKLKIVAHSDAQGGEYSYQWVKIIQDETYKLDKVIDENYDLLLDEDGDFEYYCTVTYKLNGKNYSINTESIKVRALTDKAQKATIITQPKSAEYLIKTQPESISTMANSTDGGEITYQWQVSTDKIKFTNIEGETKKIFTPPVSEEIKTFYYRCKIINTVTSISGNEYTSSVYTDIAEINFKDLNSFSEDLGYNTLEGKGTKDNPYLIKNLTDLELVRDLVNKKGILFSNMYLKMEADIDIPANWEAIGISNPDKSSSNKYLSFGGIFDGDGHTLTIEKGGKAAFKMVSKATIKNLNIYGEQIESSGLVQAYPTYSGSYNYDSTNEGYKLLYIDNVTLKSGSKTLYSGFVSGNGSGMATIFIRNSKVEKNVTIGYDKTKSDIGSFISCLNGVVNGCTSYANVYGVNHVGGIAGTKGQSMGACSIYDCSFAGNVEASGNYVGGILGSGYIAVSAPNTPCSTMSNNVNSGSITGADCVGGIFGGEGYDVECWPNGIGYIFANCSYGEVKATNGTYVGGIIGYMHNLNRYNVIYDNYYTSADKGIGHIESIDTTSSSYKRNDDLTGKDIEKLAKPISKEDLTNKEVVNLLNNATDSSSNWIQGDSGPVQTNEKHLIYISAQVKGSSLGLASLNGGEELPIDKITVLAKYSDGELLTLDNKDVEFIGFDSSKEGNIMVAVKYAKKTCYIAFKITSDAPNDQVKINFDNGKNVVSKKVTKGENLDYIPETPSKEGYEFIGWYTDVDDISTEYKNNATYTENTTYKAK